MITIPTIISEIHKTRQYQIKLRRTKRGGERAVIKEEMLNHMKSMVLKKLFT